MFSFSSTVRFYYSFILKGTEQFLCKFRTPKTHESINLSLVVFQCSPRKKKGWEGFRVVVLVCWQQTSLCDIMGQVVKDGQFNVHFMSLVRMDAALCLVYRLFRHLTKGASMAVQHHESWNGCVESRGLKWLYSITRAGMAV